jgi:hypothetical protein
MADGTIVKPGLTESCADTCCRSTPSALSLTSERAALIRQAFRLEWMTVAWMVGRRGARRWSGSGESDADGLRA